jgi:hypothetical protein
MTKKKQVMSSVKKLPGQGRLSRWIGLGSLGLLALSVNLLVVSQSLFSKLVLVPLLIAVVGGLVWFVLVLLDAIGRSAVEGRALGGLNAVFSSLVFLCICMVLYAFVQAWDVSWDLTQEGRRELAPQTVQVLESMKQEVAVTCFFLRMEDNLVMIARDKTLRFLEQCQKHTDLLEVEVLDPQLDRLRLEALLGASTHASTQGTVVIRSGARQRVITLSGASPRLEERDFTNALINVLRNVEPKVSFLTGHQERDLLDENEQTGGSMLRNLLVGESYAVERIAIKLTYPEVPRDTDILVINNPQTDLHPTELEAIEAYLDRGGRLLLLLDPWKEVRPGLAGGEALRPWLEQRYGIQVGSDIVYTDQQRNPWQAELTPDNTPFEGVDEGFMEFRGAYQMEHPVTRAFDQVMLLQASRTVHAAPEPPEGVVVTELLRTTPDFWGETDVAKLAEMDQAQRDAVDRTGPLSLAVAAVARTDFVPEGGGRPREARLVVVGNSFFASNGGMSIPGHVNFLLNTFAWLSESEDLIAIRPTGVEDPPIYLTAVEKSAVGWFSTLFTVQMVVAVGLLVYLARRKNQ